MGEETTFTYNQELFGRGTITDGVRTWQANSGAIGSGGLLYSEAVRGRAPVWWPFGGQTPQGEYNVGRCWDDGGLRRCTLQPINHDARGRTELQIHGKSLNPWKAAFNLDSKGCIATDAVGNVKPGDKVVVRGVMNQVTDGLKSAWGTVKSWGEKIGGVSLNSDFNPLFDLPSCVFGVVFDEESNTLAFLQSQRETHQVMKIDPADFALVLYSVYTQHGHCDFSFSLDPLDPMNPRGPLLSKVCYPDAVTGCPLLAGTGFSEKMFRADWALKKICMGLEAGPDGNLSSLALPRQVRVAVSKFNEVEVSSWHRFWITIGSVEIIPNAGELGFKFGKVVMKVNASKMKATASGKLEDDPSNTEASNLAQVLSDHYDTLAISFPELNELKDLAQLIALGKWLYASKVPIDVEQVRGLLQKGRVLNYEDRVRAVDASFTTTHGNMVKTRQVFGGVSFGESDSQIWLQQCVAVEGVKLSSTARDVLMQLETKIPRDNNITMTVCPLTFPLRPTCCLVCNSPCSSSLLDCDAGVPYCRNHHPSMCAACSRPISIGRYIHFGKDQKSHEECFNCCECNGKLDGKYCLSEGVPYCPSCALKQQREKHVDQPFHQAVSHVLEQSELERVLEESRGAFRKTYEFDERDLQRAIRLSLEGEKEKEGFPKFEEEREHQEDAFQRAMRISKEEEQERGEKEKRALRISMEVQECEDAFQRAMRISKEEEQERGEQEKRALRLSKECEDAFQRAMRISKEVPEREEASVRFSKESQECEDAFQRAMRISKEVPEREDDFQKAMRISKEEEERKHGALRIFKEEQEKQELQNAIKDVEEQQNIDTLVEMFCCTHQEAKHTLTGRSLEEAMNFLCDKF